MAEQSKHVVAFEASHIRNGERVLAWVEGALVQGNRLQRGALIATDKRVAFYRKGFFGSETLEALDLSKISGIDRSTHPINGRKCEFHGSGRTLAFSAKWKEKEAEQALLDAVENARTT